VPAEGLSVAELAELLAVNAAEVVKALFMKGVMAQVNQRLDLDTVRLAAAAFGAEAIEADAEVRDSPCSHASGDARPSRLVLPECMHACRRSSRARRKSL
jgi:translation initiation factor IF-2